MKAPSQRHTSTACKSCRCARLFIVLVFYLFGSSMALADEVVLTTGEKFTSSKVWEEAGKIRFNMHGLVVSVNKSDVATIIGDDGTRHLFTSPMPQTETVPAMATPSQKAPITAPLENGPDEPTYNSQAPKPMPAPALQAPSINKRDGIGLSGVKWLVSPADIPDLEKVKQDPAYGGIDQYWRPNERMQFGQALLDGKVYGFWRNQLYSIMMWAEGRIGYEHLRDAVMGHYGQGRKNSKGIERYVWFDSTTDRMLQFDDELNTGFFWMRSRQLDAQIKKHYPDG